MIKHGNCLRLARSREWRAWREIRKRCRWVKHPNFRYYGGRGITVSPAWEEFSKFLEDIGPAPTEEHQIDRIDPNGNYEPGNVRWATPTGQARNRRDNKFLTARGQTKLLVEWAEELCVPVQTLWSRLKKGMTEEETVITPIQRKPHRVVG